MTTNKLIKLVLEHGDDGCFLHGECDTYQSAPLLARKLQRARKALERLATSDSPEWAWAEARRALADIEAMQ